MKRSPRLTNAARIASCIVLLISYARAKPLREKVFHVEEVSYTECRENRFDVREFLNSLTTNLKRASSIRQTAKGKRQIQVENLSK